MKKMLINLFSLSYVDNINITEKSNLIGFEILLVLITSEPPKALSQEIYVAYYKSVVDSNVKIKIGRESNS